MTEPSEPTPTPPAPPPTQPTALPVVERLPSWPTVLGTIAIVFGALGIVCSGSTALTSSQFQSAATMPATRPTVMPAPTSLPAATATQSVTIAYATKLGPSEEWQRWRVGTSLASIGFSFVLIATGIGLITRRSWAARLSRIWAALKLVLAVAASIGMYLMLQEELGAVQGSAGPGMPPAGLVAVFGAVVPLFVFLWDAAVPVFMLVWFGRAKIKTEVARWA